MKKIVIEITHGTVCGGKIVAPGDIIEATERDARQLVGSGQAILADGPGQIREYTGETIMSRIVMAIVDLDTDNPNHFTADEKPKVDALEELLGEEVTSEQRDEAWTLFLGE